MGVMAPVTADQVADFFVRFSRERGDGVSNLKLQKLLYYAQGWYLALNREPLFDDELQAWMHGPAQRQVCGRFKRWSWNPIEADIPDPKLSDDVADHLIEVYEVYGRFSPWELERMTHSEAPWREARGDLHDSEPSEELISKKSMRRYFSDRLEASERS